jgi:hypothetical protein
VTAKNRGGKSAFFDHDGGYHRRASEGQNKKPPGQIQSASGGFKPYRQKNHTMNWIEMST